MSTPPGDDRPADRPADRPGEQPPPQPPAGDPGRDPYAPGQGEPGLGGGSGAPGGPAPGEYGQSGPFNQGQFGPGAAPPPYGQPGQPGPYGAYAGGSYPGGFAPPPPVTGPPRRSRRRIYVLVGIVALLAIVGYAAFAFLSQQDPRDTAGTFLTALQKKDFTAAHDILCKDGKAKKSADALRKDFQLDDNSITSYSIVSAKKSTLDGQKVTIVTAALTYQSGDKVTIELDVVAEGGGTLCGFKIPA